MKKIIALSLVSIVSLFLFTGCNKEKEEFSLVGTTWAAYWYSSTTLSGTPYTVYKVWRFTSDTEVEESSRDNSPQGGFIGSPRIGTYNFAYPKLTVAVGGNKTFQYDCDFIDEKCFRTVFDNGSGLNVDLLEFRQVE